MPGAVVVLLSVSLGSVLLAACGSVPAPGSGAAPAASGGAASPDATASHGPGIILGNRQVPLCQDASAVTSLRVVRAAGPKIPHEQAVFPGQVTVTSPARAREVAQALCALPVMPHGFLSCPVLFPGTTYQLTFTAEGQQLGPVNVDATGCETVTGVGQVRRVLSPQFWRVLAVATGVSPPGQSAFASPACQPPSTGAKINGCPGLYPPTRAAQSNSAAVS